MHYQLSDHGAGRYSVQVFDGDTLVSDCDIVKDINGWRVVSVNLDGYSTDTPQHRTPGAAAEWYAKILELCR